MDEDFYYSLPTQEIFDDIKQSAINIWKTYDDRFGYATEKIDRIKDLENISGNDMYMVKMFDHDNELKLLSTVRLETQDWILEKLKI
jgi:hypothetical protein